MRSACRAPKKRGIEAISRRLSHCPYLSNDLNLDRRQLGGGAACHSCSLQAEGHLSANERRDIGAVQSPRRDACQWKQKTMLSAKRQSLIGACCLYETSGDKTRQCLIVLMSQRRCGPVNFMLLTRNSPIAVLRSTTGPVRCFLSVWPLRLLNRCVSCTSQHECPCKAVPPQKRLEVQMT